MMSTPLTPPLRLAALVMALLLAACAPGEQAPGRTPGSPRFDGARAMDFVRRQVGFGPRVPGTAGHAAQAAWMRARLDSLAGEVVVDSFEHVTTRGETLQLVNLLARFRPEASRRILLLTHWDTRPRSDNAVDPALADTPIPGANDGASGTAVLLELAGLFAGMPPPMGVDLLFVDGEDYGPGLDDMLLGAKRYAALLPEQKTRPIYGVLLDMVGDVEPRFPIEEYSQQVAPIVVSKVWRAARRLGYEGVFPETIGRQLADDHVPLNQAGVPTVDVIDFDYGPGNAWWHTPGDTPDRVSAESLRIVGEVIVELIYSGG